MPNNPEVGLYYLHVASWTVFGITLMVLRLVNRGRTSSAAPAPHQAKTAPYSRALIAFHAVAFAVMYLGIGDVVFGYASGKRVPVWFAGQRLAGTMVIALGALISTSTLVYFRSWRFRAVLNESHQLASGGPFRLIRHPIYMSLNLLALGSAIWAPTPIMWVAVVWMAVGGDLRGRAEERILQDAFGETYRQYCQRTSRFVPYVY